LDRVLAEQHLIGSWTCAGATSPCASTLFKASISFDSSASLITSFNRYVRHACAGNGGARFLLEFRRFPANAPALSTGPGRRVNSPLRHIRSDLTRQEVPAHRGEQVDHLRILWKKGAVSDTTGYHGEVSRFNVRSSVPIRKLIAPLITQTNCSLRTFMGGNVHARFHPPIDHRALFAGYDAAAAVQAASR
jgi:hypothetical protein